MLTVLKDFGCGAAIITLVVWAYLKPVQSKDDALAIATKNCVAQGGKMAKTIQNQSVCVKEVL